MPLEVHTFEQAVLKDFDNMIKNRTRRFFNISNKEINIIQDLGSDHKSCGQGWSNSPITYKILCKKMPMPTRGHNVLLENEQRPYKETINTD